MRTLDRYIFRQLLVPVAGAVAALSAIALLSQSLSQFDLVVEHGQNAWTFLKVTMLSMPMLVGLIFPLAIFVGSLVAMTRMQGEHEFTAAYAAGVPLTRLTQPVLRISVYFAILSLASNLFLQPLASRAMRVELFNIKNDLISTLVKEGDFATSGTGMTIYVQRIDQNGLLRQVFIRTPSDTGQDHTYAAKEGRIKKVGASSIITLRNGSDQQMSEKGALLHTGWSELNVDITPYFASDDYLQYKEGDMYMHELFFPVKYPNLGIPKDKLLSEAHARLSAPLYNLAFALMAVVSVLGGRFSRNGYAGRIAMAAAAAGVARILGIVMESAANHAAILNILQYLVPLAPIFFCLHLIKKHDAKGAVPIAADSHAPALQALN